MKLDDNQRLKLLTDILDTIIPSATGMMGYSILKVLCSIDARLADTNDFYLQNQEERTRPND